MEITDRTPVSFDVTLAEAQLVLNIIGEQPNKSGTYPLLAKLKEQADGQVARLAKAPVLASVSNS
jgi:hypothetical protein